MLYLADSIVTPIMGSPVAGLHGQELESDSDEFSRVMRTEKAHSRHMERKKRRGKIEVSFNMGKLINSVSTIQLIIHISVRFGSYLRFTSKKVNYTLTEPETISSAENNFFF